MSNDSLNECVMQLEAINYEIGFADATKIVEGAPPSMAKQREICRSNLRAAIDIACQHQAKQPDTLVEQLECAAYCIGGLGWYKKVVDCDKAIAIVLQHQAMQPQDVLDHEDMRAAFDKYADSESYEPGYSTIDGFYAVWKAAIGALRLSRQHQTVQSVIYGEPPSDELARCDHFFPRRAAPSDSPSGYPDIDKTDWHIVKEGDKLYVKVELGVMAAYRSEMEARCSEIPVVDAIKVALLRVPVGETQYGYLASPDIMAEAVLNAIRPYLRTPVPVSVSLEKAVYAAMDNGPVEKLKDYWRIIRKAFDAAGVKYHED